MTQDRVDEEHEQHEEHDHLQDQEAELSGAALELRLGSTANQMRRDPSELRRPAGRLDSGDADAAHNRGAAQEARTGMLLGRERFSGERRLVQEEVLGGDERPVGRYEVSCRQVDDVAGDY